MNKVLEEISKIGIVPVIALDHVEDAAPLAKALSDIEISLISLKLLSVFIASKNAMGLL